MRWIVSPPEGEQAQAPEAAASARPWALGVPLIPGIIELSACGGDGPGGSEPWGTVDDVYDNADC